MKALLGCLSLTILAPLSRAQVVQPPLTHGPFIGQATPTSVSIWGRCTREGGYTASVWPEGAHERSVLIEKAGTEHDLCVVWKFRELASETTYRYEIRGPDDIGVMGDDYRFTTPPADDAKAVVKIAFGSCANEDEGTRSVWKRMQSSGAQTIVLLGDTPYIDSTDLEVQRRRYREFDAVEEMSVLLRSTSWYGTWDDHDLGRDNTDGTLPGKEHSLQAFVEYHANPSYGDGKLGVYTKFRRGAVEVFLLDTRWFSGTEPSPFAADKTTLLGKTQWDWLKRELQASKAPLKILACGMIWNSAVRPNKSDYWGRYSYEYDALMKLIGEKKIHGIVLVGGDIHRSRAVLHKTAASAGYDIPELITSPMHASIIEAANQPVDGLLWDSGAPHSFLIVTVDSTKESPSLSALFTNAAGEKLFEITYDTKKLAPVK